MLKVIDDYSVFTFELMLVCIFVKCWCSFVQNLNFFLYNFNFFSHCLRFDVIFSNCFFMFVSMKFVCLKLSCVLHVACLSLPLPFAYVVKTKILCFDFCHRMLLIRCNFYVVMHFYFPF